MKSFGSSASGLQCSWGSDLDTRIPRPKMPKQALPDSVRKNLGLKDNRKSSKRFSDSLEIAPEVHSTKGGMEAKAYLKMKSGVPMSTRTSGLVAMKNGRGICTEAAKEMHRQQRALLQNENQNKQLMVVRRQQKREQVGMPVKGTEMGFGEVAYNHAADGRQRAKFQLNRNKPVNPGTWR